MQTMLDNLPQIKVLLIQEDPEDARLIHDALAAARDAAFGIEWAHSLSEGLEFLRRDRLDLVLLDLDRPEGQGLVQLMKVRAEAPTTPIVVMSGISSAPLAIQAIEAGAQDYLVKEQMEATAVSRRLLHTVERQAMLARIERDRQEMELSMASFRNIIDSNADGIAVIDQKRVVRFVNPALEALFGRRAEELLCELFEFPVVAGQTCEVNICAEDAEDRVAEMRVMEAVWEGEPVYLASLRDVTARKRTEEQLRRSLEKLKQVLEGTVQAMAMAVEMRDPYTAGHERRVAALACAIAERMGLPPDQIEGIRIAGLLHDVGKIRVPAEILNKPGPASEIESAMLKTHSEVGYDILKAIEFPWPIAQIVLQHHERLDGSGYPGGLMGEDIVLEAGVVAVADVVEAMASHRPYRPALGIDKALDEISQNRGKLYEPVVVDSCLALFSHGEFSFDSPEFPPAAVEARLR